MTNASLKTLIAAAIFIVSLVLTIGVSYVIGQDAVTRLEQQIGQSLAVLADETQDKVDRLMYERLQALNSIAVVGELTPQSVDRPSARRALEAFRSVYSDFSWLGLIDSTGIVATATDGILEGQNVADQSLFIRGLNEPYVGDGATVRTGVDIDKTDNNAELKYFDLAVPLIDNAGVHMGVLGANLSTEWSTEIRDGLLGSLTRAVPADVIVLNEQGDVLLGPADIKGKSLDLPSVRAARTGRANYASEVWPDGKSYLTGFSKSDGYRSYPGLRWIVLVRESQLIAFAPARHLLRNIAAIGAAFSALAALIAWLLASKLARPLLQLSDAAENLRKGHQHQIPEVGGYIEAATLSHSLHSLISELGVQRQALAASNQSLEGQVHERTKQLAEQNISLAKAKSDAEQATEAKSRFLAAASHDLRQPLHALTLFARALSRRVTGDEAPTLVAQMEEALRGLKGMFDALLNISRLDAKLITPAKTLFSIAEIIDRIAAGARTEAAQSNLRFISRSQNWLIQSDPALLETIIRNLVSNALKFTKEGGVMLACRHRMGLRAIDVYDTGPGLAPEQQTSIFQEFSRAENGASGVNDGLGLGLSIARRYAELLGMQVQMCSRPGQGSRFTILLPAEIADGGAVKLSSTAATQRSIAPKAHRILVLDDEPLIVNALSRDLSDRGNTVLGYHSVLDAEKALTGGVVIDAAVIDYDLRGPETGIDFIERMSKQAGKHIPALVLSGGTDAGTLAALAKSGRPWLTKPADPELIEATLYSALNERSALDDEPFNSGIAHDN